MTTSTAPSYAAGVPAPAPGKDTAGSGSNQSYSGAYDITQRDVIYNASINITVNTVTDAVNQVQSIAKTAGGTVESMYSGGGQDQQQANITIRVPQAQFFAVMEQLQGLGTVQNQNVSSQDVTQQFIDLQARLKTSQAEEQSLLSLLGKAETISDIITIQTQLTQVRAEIESLQGQVNYMQNQVDMSTITVSMSVIGKPTGQAPSASLTVGVSNVAGSAASVKQLVEGSKGIIDANSFSSNNGKDSAYLSMRVYRADFDRIVSAIEKQGKVEQKTIQEAVNQTVEQASSNIPPDAVISLALVTQSGGFWTGANIAIIAIAGGVVIVALLVFLGLAWRGGLIGKRD